MALQEAYGQTDVRHDPNWIINNYLGSRNPTQQAIGHAMLQNLEREQRDREMRQNLELQLGSREATAAEGRASRESIAHEGAAERASRERAIEQARTDSLAERQMEAKYKEYDALTDLSTKLPPNDPRQKQIQDRAASLMGFPAQGAAPQTPAQAALQRAGQAAGERVAPTQGAASAAGGIAAAAPPAGAAGTPPTGTAPTGTFSPGTLTQGGGAGVGTFADQARAAIEHGKATGTPYLEAGQVFNAPRGYDYNVSTGQWIPSTTEGTINGIPASRALAEGALRSGVNPIYSPKAMDLLEGMRAEGKALTEAGLFKPTLPVGPTGLPATGTEVAGGPIPKPAGAGELVSPTGGVGGGGTQQTAAGATAPGAPSENVGAFGTPTAQGVGAAFKGAGQGLFPGIFGFPPGTPGAQEAGASRFEPGDGGAGFAVQHGGGSSWSPAGLANQPAQTPQTPGTAPGAQPSPQELAARQKQQPPPVVTQ